MPKNDKTKVNVKERVDENVCDLSLSELNEVPVREIASFKRISILDLSSNRLTSLGRNFTSLTRLVKLDLSKNQIKFLPDDFGVLQNLRHLDLYDNKLEHLPLSFGNLVSLRYLDLKGNPLIPALAKIVGFCLTTKECQDTARNTVKFLAFMQTEAEKKKIELLQTQTTPVVTPTENEAIVSLNGAEIETEKSLEIQKKTAKKTKTKSKKNTTQANHVDKNQNNAINNNEAASKDKATKTNKTKGKKTNNANSKKLAENKSSTALTSISLFIFLLAINIGVIYMIMFKNPEIADKLVELIPLQYRDWIITKTEFFRLRVTDWISQFITPPDEH